ncbi:MAG: polysaccharide deacetylase family protein [Thermoplasmatota archaeon]
MQAAREKTDDGSKYRCVVTFYHDIEQNIDSSADVDRCRDAVNELLKIEKKHGIAATYNIVGKLYKEQPGMIRRIIDSGGEVAFHSFNHQNDWKPAYYGNEVRLCREASPLPTGYRSPRSQWNLSTLKALEKFNFIWSAESDPHGEPYLIRDRLIRLPISQDDWILYKRKIPFKDWRQQFMKGIGRRNYYAVGTHDYILSEGEDFIDNWEKLIEGAVESNIYTVSFMQGADLYMNYLNSKNRGNKTEDLSPLFRDYRKRSDDDKHVKLWETYPLERINFQMDEPGFPILRNSMSLLTRRIKKGLSR